MSYSSSNRSRRHPALLDMRPVEGTTIPRWQWEEYLKQNPGTTVQQFVATCKAGAKYLHGIVLEMDARVEKARQKRLAAQAAPAS